MRDKKVIIIAQCDIGNLADGVSQKVLSQISAFKYNGFSVTSITYYFSSIVIRDEKSILQSFNVKSRFFRRIDFWNVVRKHILKSNYEIVYIRYPVIDFVFFKTLKILKKRCNKVVMELPSYPIPRDMSFLKRVNSIFINPQKMDLSKYIDYIFYIGNYVDSVFKCKSLQIPNGIPTDMKSIEPTGFNYDGKIINMVAVSNMFDTHGYERIIEGIKDYYQSAQDEKIYLFLVGDGPCKDEYEELVKKYGLEKYIIFTGILKGDQLTEQYKKATIGIGSLGLFKQGYTEASTLKVKEYFARGLPFIYSTSEIELDSEYEFALRFQSDVTPICIKDIIRFVDLISLKNKNEIIRDMKAYSSERFEWNSIVKKELVFMGYMTDD